MSTVQATTSLGYNKVSHLSYSPNQQLAKIQADVTELSMCSADQIKYTTTPVILRCFSLLLNP